MKLNIYDEIRKDHLEIESLFRRIFALEVDEHSQHFLRHRLVADLRKCWVSHARAEESVLYNRLRRLDILTDLVRESYTEHLEVESQLRLLEVRDRIETDWAAAAHNLFETFMRHRKEEEDAVFSVAEELFTEAEALRMGRHFLRAKANYGHQGWLRTGVELLANAFDFKDPTAPQ